MEHLSDNQLNNSSLFLIIQVSQPRVILGAESHRALMGAQLKPEQSPVRTSPKGVDSPKEV